MEFQVAKSYIYSAKRRRKRTQTTVAESCWKTFSRLSQVKTGRFKREYHKDGREKESSNNIIALISLAKETRHREGQPGPGLFRVCTLTSNSRHVSR